MKASFVNVGLAAKHNHPFRSRYSLDMKSTVGFPLHAAKV